MIGSLITDFRVLQMTDVRLIDLYLVGLVSVFALENGGYMLHIPAD